MTTVRDRVAPSGWYAIGPVRGPTLQPIFLAGQRLVMWRRPGGARLMDGLCPHLGADLSVLGEVVDDSIRCPFHGFRFGEDGSCVATGYGTRPPRRAALRSWPLVDRHGLWFAWYGADGEQPTWQLPEVEDEAWSPYAMRTLTMRGHPQDVTENSVDVGHFSWVHGYRDVVVLDPLQVDGPSLRTRYAFSRPLMAATAGPAIHQEIDLHVHGLGYSRVEVMQKETGLPLRLLVLPTPRGEGVVDLHLGLALPASVPAVLRTPLQQVSLAAYVHEVRQDERFWAHKHPVHPPALAKGDGPIGRYQSWARQFYPEAA